eukprot:TRINITY_DN20863_c0_g2_i2.p1 TRINITY_DN20863_c0_g2~~TRINITY_DN20863_c0_g2_i2.p1  ORF type:complete len:1070 (+),score=349.90 TRINITY_DN20863_c0_g2_i2:99-3308(+)
MALSAQHVPQEPPAEFVRRLHDEVLRLVLQSEALRTLTLGCAELCAREAWTAARADTLLVDIRPEPAQAESPVEPSSAAPPVKQGSEGIAPPSAAEADAEAKQLSGDIGTVADTGVERQIGQSVAAGNDGDAGVAGDAGAAGDAGDAGRAGDAGGAGDAGDAQVSVPEGHTEVADPGDGAAVDSTPSDDEDLLRAVHEPASEQRRRRFSRLVSGPLPVEGLDAQAADMLGTLRFVSDAAEYTMLGLQLSSNSPAVLLLPVSRLENPGRLLFAAPGNAIPAERVSPTGPIFQMQDVQVQARDSEFGPADSPILLSLFEADAGILAFVWHVASEMPGVYFQTLGGEPHMPLAADVMRHAAAFSEPTTEDPAAAARQESAEALQRSEAAQASEAAGSDVALKKVASLDRVVEEEAMKLEAAVALIEESAAGEEVKEPVPTAVAEAEPVAEETPAGEQASKSEAETLQPKEEVLPAAEPAPADPSIVPSHPEEPAASKTEEAASELEKPLPEPAEAGAPISKPEACDGDSLLDEADSEYEYVIELNKTEGVKLGIDVCKQTTSMLKISAVVGGLLKAWNERHAEHMVLPGDCIVDVNGVRGTAIQLAGECKKTGILRVTLRRGCQEQETDAAVTTTVSMLPTPSGSAQVTPLVTPTGAALQAAAERAAVSEAQPSQIFEPPPRTAAPEPTPKDFCAGKASEESSSTAVPGADVAEHAVGVAASAAETKQADEVDPADAAPEPKEAEEAPPAPTSSAVSKDSIVSDMNAEGVAPAAPPAAAVAAEPTVDQQQADATGQTTSAEPETLESDSIKAPAAAEDIDSAPTPKAAEEGATANAEPQDVARSEAATDTAATDAATAAVTEPQEVVRNEAAPETAPSAREPAQPPDEAPADKAAATDSPCGAQSSSSSSPTQAESEAPQPHSEPAVPAPVQAADSGSGAAAMEPPAAQTAAAENAGATAAEKDGAEVPEMSEELTKLRSVMDQFVGQLCSLDTDDLGLEDRSGSKEAIAAAANQLPVVGDQEELLAEVASLKKLLDNAALCAEDLLDERKREKETSTELDAADAGSEELAI